MSKLLIALILILSNKLFSLEFLCFEKKAEYLEGSKEFINLSKEEFADLIKKQIQEKKVNVCDVNGNTLLAASSYLDDIDSVKKLLEAKADPNIVDIRGQLPLMIISSKKLPGRLSIAKHLIENGTNINKKSNSGSTALISAACHNDYELAQLLLNYKRQAVDIEAYDREGSTALTFAMDGSLEIAKLLILKGANVTVKSVEMSFRWDSEARLKLIKFYIKHRLLIQYIQVAPLCDVVLEYYVIDETKIV